MRTSFVFLAALSLLGSGCVYNIPDRKAAEQIEPLGCTIRGERTCELGKVPKITVAITNQTNADIYLVGSLDASDCKWRYPLCYFEVIGPDGKSAAEGGKGCGNVSELREKNFVKVSPGRTFDPYQQIGDHGFFFASQLNSRTFRTTGEYRIRFFYSTNSNNMDAWFGDAENDKLVGLLRQVPKVEIRSNEIKVSVVERSN